MRQRRQTMQEAVRAALHKAVMADRGQTEVSEDDDPVEDFGFYHPHNSVLSCWFALRNWKVLPAAGGWLDQPEAWQYDLLTCQRVYNEEFDLSADRGPTVDDLLEGGPTLPMFGE